MGGGGSVLNGVGQSLFIIFCFDVSNYKGTAFCIIASQFISKNSLSLIC